MNADKLAYVPEGASLDKTSPVTCPVPVQVRRSLWFRVGQLGFWFFLLKGLLWLTVPIAATWLGYQLPTH